MPRRKNPSQWEIINQVREKLAHLPEKLAEYEHLLYLDHNHDYQKWKDRQETVLGYRMARAV